MPFPYTQAVIAYEDDVQQGTFITPLQLALKMQACVLNPDDIAAIATLTSDTTVETATGARRTLTYALGQEFNACLQPIPDLVPGEEGNSLTLLSGADSADDTPGTPGYPGSGTPGAGPSVPNPPLASASGPFQNLYTITLRKFLSSNTLRQLPPIVT
jgi:hypothetical protein